MNELLFRLAAWCVCRHANPIVGEAINKQPDGGIGAEAPIRTASEDRLRRTEFASRIADVL